MIQQVVQFQIEQIIHVWTIYIATLCNSRNLNWHKILLLIWTNTILFTQHPKLVNCGFYKPHTFGVQPYL